MFEGNGEAEGGDGFRQRNVEVKTTVPAGAEQQGLVNADAGKGRSNRGKGLAIADGVVQAEGIQVDEAVGSGGTEANANKVSGILPVGPEATRLEGVLGEGLPSRLLVGVCGGRRNNRLPGVGEELAQALA